MSPVELLLVVDPITDDTKSSLQEGRDVFVRSQAGLTVVGARGEWELPLNAAMALVESFEQVPGVRVDRCCEDLVTFTDVMTRTGVASDDLMEWMQRPPDAADRFPEPYNLVGGGVWLWGEVHDWLSTVGKGVDSCRFPTRGDHWKINCWLAGRRES